MKQYKGKYIGKGYYASKAEVDQEIKQSKLAYMKKLIRIFAQGGNPLAAVELSKIQNLLVNEYGCNWEELEAIEAEVYKAS